MNWIFWAGIGIFVGGLVSFSMNAAVETLSFEEDLSGYSIGWMAAGAILIAYGFLSRRS